MTATRYCAVKDNDSHWYLIPTGELSAWNKWREIPGDDERSWDPPAFSKRIDGPHTLTFTDPQVPA